MAQIVFNVTRNLPEPLKGSSADGAEMGGQCLLAGSDGYSRRTMVSPSAAAALSCADKKACNQTPCSNADQWLR